MNYSEKVTAALRWIVLDGMVRPAMVFHKGWRVRFYTRADADWFASEVGVKPQVSIFGESPLQRIGWEFPAY